MARPSFKNIGLRRDLNLADLTSKDQALNNVLNNLVVGSDNKVFTGGDLDAIKGISNSTVTNRDIGLMAGLAVKNTVLEDGELVDANGSVTIAGDASLESDSSPALSANLNANGFAITNVGTLIGNNVESSVYDVDVRTLNDLYINLDFGDFESNTDNFVDFFKSLVDADYGSLTTPILLNTDNGLLPTL